ncbi:PREDICTED: phosphofurin acidic cluster sorting protein 1-like [Cyprinodon variegatus]|nr:PREDICTED: phosphofurin acidic cluster sorting protein 1-like [Cyprinodon variegatus]
MAAAADRGGFLGVAVPSCPAAAAEPSEGSEADRPTDCRVAVPMNLYATWEVERSSPSCVPRLCSLTLKKLMLFRELDQDLTSFIIAVKIQGSKRTLRSSEYLLPPGSLVETDLELTFSLQYPHFLKRDTNRLHVMLQRRKKYKNRTILGYKSLAVGVINMDEVMQHPTDGAQILGLHSNQKDASVRAAELSVHSLSSQPVEQEDVCSHHGNKTKASDRSPDTEHYWEDDDDSFFSDQEGSDDALPPQEMQNEDDDIHRKIKRSHRKILQTASLAQHPNLKQKLVALLKRFRITDESDPVGQTQDAESDQDLDLLYGSIEVDNMSDSGRDIYDLESIQSTPKPKLRPFFESNSQIEMRSLEHQKEQTAAVEPLSAGVPRSNCTEGPREDEEVEDGALATDAGSAAKTELQTHISPSKTGSQHPTRTVSLKDRQHSRGMDRNSSVDSETSCDHRIPAPQVARKVVLDQLNSILLSEDQVPDSIILINTTDWQGQYLSELLFDQPIVCSVSSADVQAAFSTIIARLQRFCNYNSQTPPTVKVGVAGDQSYLNTVLNCFVDQLANKTPDWLHYLCFLIIPYGVHPLAKYLSVLDGKFGSLFLDAGWRELFGRAEPPLLDPLGVSARVCEYVAGAAVSHLCPISEAMLTCKHRSPEDDSFQKFVPFIGVVNVGLVEQNFLSTSVDSDDFILGSPPCQSGVGLTSTPPPSPSISSSAEMMGLQVDYWTHSGGGGGGGAAEWRKEVGMKNSLKNNFRCLQVSRLSAGELMSMTVVMKEKNKKVMFLSKKAKEKEVESRSQVIEGISRLICTSKHQHTLRVSVDGVEWNDVKFFQLAAQWPTHVKHFPVGIFGYSKL